MKELDKFTDEQLDEELIRRAREKAKAAMPKPTLIQNWTPLTDYILHAADQVNTQGYEPKDFEHYCFEMALEAVFGSDIWQWWNKKLHGE